MLSCSLSPVCTHSFPLPTACVRSFSFSPSPSLSHVRRLFLFPTTLCTTCVHSFSPSPSLSRVRRLFLSPTTLHTACVHPFSSSASLSFSPMCHRFHHGCRGPRGQVGDHQHSETRRRERSDQLQLQRRFLLGDFDQLQEPGTGL